MTRPKHAVAYHFQNDFDTLPAIIRTVEQSLRRPGGLRAGLHGVERHQRGCAHTDGRPPTRSTTRRLRFEKSRSPRAAIATRHPEWVLDGFPDEVDAVAKQIFADFNKEHGTNYKFKLK